MDSKQLQLKTQNLQNIIASLESVIVAYSGGVDSSLIAHIAHKTLGKNNTLIVTANSPSMAPYELQDAKAIAETKQWNYKIIQTQEMQDPRYAANTPARCFFCKTELYTQLKQLAQQTGFKTIANGANADDLGDYRPGMKAATNFSVRSPFVEANINKQDIRTLAHKAGLPNWNKPAQPCLSSRIPYGTHVTTETLRMISNAEKHLRKLGFPQCRVRHHDKTAKIEIPKHQIPKYMSPHIQPIAEAGIIAAGYQYVELDPKGFRSGSLNETLTKNNTPT